MSEIGEGSRVEKGQREQQESPEQPQSRRCYDWIVVSGHCHYAKHRASFSTYRPITKGTAQGIQVAGIGTVELEVTRSPQSSETNTLVLEDVLHIPSAICNGFRFSALGGTEYWTADVVQGFDGPGGRPAWYATEFCELQRLVLAGNPQGESELRDNRPMLLSIYLSGEEKAYLFPQGGGARDS